MIDDNDEAERKYCWFDVWWVDVGCPPGVCVVVAFKFGKSVVEVECVNGWWIDVLDGTVAKGDDNVKSAAACGPALIELFNGLLGPNGDCVGLVSVERSTHAERR